MIATQLDAYQLMHEGALAFAEIEHDGFRVDVEYLQNAKREVTEEIRVLKAELMSDEVYKLQSRRFGQKTNLGSRPQLASVLTNDLNLSLDLTELSKGGGEDEEEFDRDAPKRYQTDKKALDGLNLPYLKKFIQLEELKKLDGTYFDGLIRETVDGYVHTCLNLHLAKSFRSTDDDPNLQNLPVRNKRISQLLRTAFIPRDGHKLIDFDYGSLEFRIASCFWKDPAMVRYASDSTKDIHGDCATLLYKLPKNSDKKSAWFKDARYCAKNKFLFPELYGDFYIACAMSLWESISLLNLNVDGLSMDEHLRNCGIHSLGKCDSKQAPMPGTFENHVKKAETTYFEWFPVLKENKEKFWKQYQRDGYFDLMSGFRIQGVWKRTFVLNAIVQGPAFHILLWSLIQIVKWLKKNRMKSKVVLEVHDSITIDAHESEIDDVMAKVIEVMTIDVKKHYPWIITPLSVEVEMSESNWYEKVAIAI